jgi:hypothetical protein
MSKYASIKYRLLTYIVVLSLFVIMTGKFWSGLSAGNGYLHFYGVTITAVVLRQFFIAFARYRDPYLISQDIPKQRQKQYFVSSLMSVRNEENIIRQCIDSFLNQTYKTRS